MDNTIRENSENVVSDIIMRKAVYALSLKNMSNENSMIDFIISSDINIKNN